MFSEFFLALENSLKAKLPGTDAQQKLAPSLRHPGFDFYAEDENTKESAVLILIFPMNEELCVAFIKRQTYKGVHSGQISFPGGKRENNDKDLQETALRETNEEIGINPKDVKILGKLTPLYIPVSNINVFPFIGFSNTMPQFVIDKHEVQELIIVKIKDFLNQKNYSREFIIEIDFEVDVPYFDANGNHIWGATAMILSEFVEIVKNIRI